MLNGLSTLRLQRMHALELKFLASNYLMLAKRFLLSQMLKLITQLTRESGLCSGRVAPISGLC